MYSLVPIVIIFVVYQIYGYTGSSSPVPTMKVERGQFIVSLAENGRLDALKSVTISAPRIRGGLQVIKLAKEGSIVEEGDFLIQFDPTEPETRLREAESELKIADANLERARGQFEIDIMQLELDLKKAERIFSEKQSEAPVIRREAELERDLAQLKYKTQGKMLQAEIRKQQVEVDKATESRDRANRDLKKMTVTAPIPGLVVYLEIWKGGTMEKIQEGDAPWGGQGLINLPNLSSLIVETNISEVDVSRIKLDQRVELRLDAVPGPVFEGKISDIGTLAHRKERGSRINVFDVKVLLDSTDDRLKPGMSARVDIIIDIFEDVLSIPIEAVFERDDTTIVYNAGGDMIVVSLGLRNDNSVIITSGLEEGDEVSLVDPNRDMDDARNSGDGDASKTKKKSRKQTTQTVIIGG